MQETAADKFAMRMKAGSMSTKSEHRHELKQNDLAQLALKLGKQFEVYGNQILLGLAAVFLIAGAVIWTMRSSKADKERGWTAYAAASSAEDFESVADDVGYEGTEVGSWARLSAAENHLASGIQMSFTDRPAAIDELDQAEENFDKLLANSSISKSIRERALIGMARCQEATSDGDTAEAIKTYKTFLTEFPDSIYKELAQKRIDALGTGSAQDFYAWFHQQNPKPEDRQFPQDGLPAGHPEIDPFKNMSEAFAPTGLDRWASPETIPNLLRTPIVEEKGPELSFPPEPDAPESKEESSPDKGDKAAKKTDEKKDE